MKLLLHACCGPCSCYQTEKLAADGRQFDILFFNPNIHPYKEFKRRLNTLMEFCEKKQYNLIIDKKYDLEEWVCGMLEEPGIRCAFCYRERLRYAAHFASVGGYDAFTSTLLVSPYQKHELIIKCAEASSKEFDIPFYYEDFRTGYQSGVRISLEIGLYRQPYCGCIFSERDRYAVTGKKEEKERFIRINKFITMVKS